MLKQCFFVLLCVLLFFISSLQANSLQSLNVAVASNFRATLEQIIVLFEDEYPDIDIVVTSGASGILSAQISHGAPYDLFLSADEKMVDRLVELDAVDANAHSIYARGRLVLLVRTDKKKNSESTKSESVLNEENEYKGNKILPQLLCDKKLVYANPKLAPYGLAAEQVLSHVLARNSNCKYQKIIANNVIHGWQLFQLGHADVAILPDSMIKQWLRKNEQPHSGAQFEWFVIDSDMHQRIQQRMAVIKQSKNKQNALLLYRFVLMEKIQKVIAMDGYFSPAIQLGQSNER